ncbi:MAG: thiamine pyrophosphate-binding protein [Acutalibacteraceae bacterium]
MRIKVSDYIARFLAKNKIEHVFTVVGGGAMHLNDSLGHCDCLRCIYVHHEQAASIAAESFARINGEIAAVCVTTGPGGINALTGVCGAYLDSVPMLVISGQVRYETTARSTGLDLRAMGDQEFDIVKSAEAMTKLAVMVQNPADIRYWLEKALYTALSGRQGPAWLDIPLDVQGAYVNDDELIGYVREDIDAPIDASVYNTIIEKIKNAKRPVLNAGNAIRLSLGFESFRRVADLLNIPVVTGWNSIDLIEDDNPLYAGRAGIMGDRAGNFAVQNSDLVLSIGSRLSIRQVGYNYKSWARDAYVIMVDIDSQELKKPSLHVDLPICADCKDFLDGLYEVLGGKALPKKEQWLSRCALWREKYPVVTPKHLENGDANVYAFIKKISQAIEENTITVVGNGSASVVGSHAFVIKKGSRFIINSAIASMGYDLPAATGACFASGGEDVICITGDGSIQMNIQELQTIVHHKLPVKLFVINNGGYHSIRQTQSKFFGGPLIGIGIDSGDLSFPSLKRIAYAYDIPYFYADKTQKLEDTVRKALALPGYVLAEIVVTTDQAFEPKAASKIDSNGQMRSAPLEDLYPFLPEEELKENMIIPLWKE